VSNRLAAIIGLTLILASLHDAFEAVLLPRRVERRHRFVHYYYRVTWAIWSRIGARLPIGSARESILSVYGPMSMILLFALWAVGLILGFGFLQYALQAFVPAGMRTSLSQQFYLSGDSFFTLGTQTLVSRPSAVHVLVFIEAGTGFGFIGLMVGYLPVLYHHFTQRDLQLIQLDARAGSPPTAATVLSRCGIEGTLEQLDDWLRDWEVWAAELIESHSSYPMLAFYRSQHEKQSWLASLAIILDCCTVIVSGVENMSSLQAGATFVAARKMLTEIGRSLNVRPPSQAKVRLPKEMFKRIEGLLVASGFVWDAGPEAEQTLLQLQNTYEPLLQALSAYLLLPLPMWIRDGEEVLAGEGRKTLARRLTRNLDL